jgi:hypothetical protein
MILSKLFFSKHQNKAEFKNLDDSEVLSSDFPVLDPYNLNDLNSLNNLCGLNELYSLILSKKIIILIIELFPVPI